MIHTLDDGTVTISSGRAWLPGIYDCPATARWAFRFPDATLQALSARICRAEGEGRPITREDLRRAASACRTSGLPLGAVIRLGPMGSHHDGGSGPAEGGWSGGQAIAWATVISVAAWAGLWVLFLWAAGDLPAYRDAALAVLLGLAAWAALFAFWAVLLVLGVVAQRG